MTELPAFSRVERLCSRVVLLHSLQARGLPPSSNNSQGGGAAQGGAKKKKKRPGAGPGNKPQAGKPQAKPQKGGGVKIGGGGGFTLGRNT
jgi:hypothetical protein